MALAGCDAVLFDAYGTLLDLSAVVTRVADRALANPAAAGALIDLWRRKQLEYTWLRTLMGRHAPFDTVTADALDYAAAALPGTLAAGARDLLLDSYKHGAAFPEAERVLAAVKAGGKAAAVLSNGTPSGLASAFAPAAEGGTGLGRHLDALASVEAVGVYKPSPPVYAHGMTAIGIEDTPTNRARVCFVSSNGWDAAGAAAFGFRVVWVNRAGAPVDRLPGEPAAVVSDLTGLPPLLGLPAV